MYIWIPLELLILRQICICGQIFRLKVSSFTIYLQFLYIFVFDLLFRRLLKLFMTCIKLSNV